LEQHNYCFWLDYATLLAQQRGQTLSPWEHDSDFSVLHPDYYYQPTKQNNNFCPHSSEDIQVRRTSSETRSHSNQPLPHVLKLLQLFQSKGYETTWVSSRNLLQVGPAHLPHVDLWLFIPEFPPNLVETPVGQQGGEDEDGVELWTGDYDTHYNPRRYADIFPLNRRNEGWANISSVAIPNRASTVSQAEYGHYGPNFMTPVVTRGDWFHNLFQGRMFY